MAGHDTTCKARTKEMHLFTSTASECFGMNKTVMQARRGGIGGRTADKGTNESVEVAKHSGVNTSAIKYTTKQNNG